MDALISVLIAIAIFALSSSSAKKKKQQQQAKKVQQTAAKKRDVYEHPYAESPKEKGMSLDDYRRKYQGDLDKKVESIGDWVEKNISTEGWGTEGKTSPQPSAEGLGTEGDPFRSIPKKNAGKQVAKKQPKAQNKQAAKPAAAEPKAKTAIPVKKAGGSGQKHESAVLAGNLQSKYEQNFDSGVDVAAFMASKNLTPVQQGFVWAELFGPPKAKRGNSYFR